MTREHVEAVLVHAERNHPELSTAPCGAGCGFCGDPFSRTGASQSIAAACILRHSAYMPKDAAVTVRIPLDLKRRLEAHARREKRSLSAQIMTCLEREVADESPPPRGKGRLLGLYEGTPVPTDRDFVTARRSLWNSLGSRRARRGA